MSEISRDTVVPLYIQIAGEIKSKIEYGELPANSKIPTEMELSSDYGVSRITIRKALEMLVEEGILIRRQRVGTFVSDKKVSGKFNNCMGFTESCELEGSKPGTRFLTAELVKAKPFDVESLELAKDDKVIRIRRIRYCNDVPVVLEETHFCKRYAYLLAEDLNRSLHEILREYGVIVKKGSKIISICHATREEAEYLQIMEQDALILSRDVAYDMSGKPVYCRRDVINAERYQYKILVNNVLSEE